MSLHRATRSGCRALENAVAASAMKRVPHSLGVLRQLAVPHLIAFQGNAADGCGVRSGLHKAGWFVERSHVNEAGYVNSGAVFRPSYVVREGLIDAVKGSPVPRCDQVPPAQPSAPIVVMVLKREKPPNISARRPNFADSFACG